MCHACAAAAGAGDGYEYSEPITVSAIAGTPKLPSPYNTECEYSIEAITFTDAGGVTISSGQFPPAASNAFTTAGSEYGYSGRVFYAPAATILAFANTWTRLGGNALYFNFAMTNGHAAHVVLVFRRRLPAMALVPHMEGAEYASEHAGGHGQNIGGASQDNGRMRQTVDQYADASRGARTR